MKPLARNYTTWKTGTAAIALLAATLLAALAAMFIFSANRVSAHPGDALSDQATTTATATPAAATLDLLTGRVSKSVPAADVHDGELGDRADRNGERGERRRQLAGRARKADTQRGRRGLQFGGD